MTVPIDKARKMRNLTEAWNVAHTAGQLFDALNLSGGEYDTRASHRLFDLCTALIDLLHGGDAETMRDSLMHELGIDEHGNPVREVIEFNPSLVHPDDPCQSKGYAA